MEFLSYLFVILPFVIAFLLALGLCTLSILFINSATVAMGTMTAIFLLETASMEPIGLNLGIYIYPPDLLVILLLPAFFYRLLFLKKFNAIPRAWWALGVVWMGLFAWGGAQYGTGAGVDFRSFFYFWLGAAYLATFDYDEAFARSFMKFFIIIGVGVCATAYYRWTMGEIDYQFHRELETLDTTGIKFMRVVAANAAFMLTCGLFVVAYQAVGQRTNPVAWLLAVIFGITVVAMQHRSVWLAAVAGFVALAMALRQIRKGVGSKLVAIALAGAVLLILIVASGHFQGAVSSVEDQAASATSTTGGTFVGRVVGWQALLKLWVNSGSPVTYLVGKPFGGGYERYETDFGGPKIGYAPHNFYVQLLYRGGLLGLGTFLWAVVQSINTLRAKLRRKDDAMAPLLFAMLVAQLVYYIPYGIDYGQMILFGLLFGMITKERTLTKVADKAMLETKGVTRLWPSRAGGVHLHQIK
jgi:hypothetical protein